MAVMTLDALGGSELAKQVGDFWTRHNNARMRWLNASYDLRSYLASADTTTTEVGRLGWKNNTTIPKLTQLYDTLHAYYMAALFPDDDWFVFEGSNREADEKADLIEQYLRVKLKESGFEEVISQVVADWIMYGDCFASMHWVQKTGVNIETKEPYTRFMGPKAFRIDPASTMIDPRARSFDESFYINRAVKHISELAEFSEVFSPEVISKVSELRSLPKDDITDTFKEMAIEIDGFDSFTDYLASGYVEVIQFYGDVYNPATNTFEKDRDIVVVDRLFVARNEAISAWTYDRPVAHAGWRRLPGNLYSQGPLQQLVGMQYRCDHLENAKADIFDQIIHPVVVRRGEVVEEFTFGPGAELLLGEGDEVEIIRPDSNALTADNQIALYHQQMEEMAGVPREMAGFRTPGEKTAFEVGVLQEGADRLFLDKVRSFEEHIIRPLLNMAFELVVRNLDIPDIVKVFDNRSQTEQFVGVTREDVTATGVIRPVGSRHYAARRKRVQELQNVLQLVATTPSMVPHFSGLNAGLMLEEELGTERYNLFAENIGIMEQIQSQAAAQSMASMMGQAGGGGEDPDSI